MPAPIVKKLAKEKGISVKEAEKRWDKAKKITREQTGRTEEGGDDFWAYVVGVFKKSMGEKLITESAFQMWESPEQAIEYMKKAKAIDDIQIAFNRVFRTGDKKEREVRLAMADVITIAFEQAKNADANSIEALGAENALLQVWKNDQAFEDADIDRDTLFEVRKSIGRDPEKSGENAYEVFSGIGKSLVSEIPADTIQNIKEVQGQIKGLKDDIKRITAESQSLFTQSRSEVLKSPEYLDTLKSHSKEIQDIADGYQEYFRSDEFRALSYKDQKKTFKSKHGAYKKETKLLREGFRDVQESFFSEIDDLANLTIKNMTKSQQKVLEILEEKQNGYAKTVKNAVFLGLLEASPITEEQADQWVEKNVHVAENALSRLKRSKVETYKNIAAIKSDMKEFFRLVGGKIGRIKIVTKGGKRAAAYKKSGEIAVDSNFSKKTLFHEMGHHVEFGNMSVNLAAQHYRKKMSKSDKLMSLRSLAHKGYRPNEVAYSDGFFDPYVGKYYRDGSTEVVSMGLQQLSSVDNVIDLLSKDRGHLEMVIGMSTQQDEATMALMKAKTIAYASEIESEKLKDAWQKELKRVASKKATDPYLKENRGDDFPYLEKPYRGKNMAVYFENSWGDAQNHIFPGIQDARNFLYLYLVNKNGLLPDKLTEDAIYRLIRFDGNPPEWFTEDMKLPKLGAI